MRHPFVFLLLISTLATALRIWVAAAGGVWSDEAALLFLVDSPSWGEMIRFLQIHEAHPPLFYSVMRVWLSIAGSGDFAALALPIALGVALVPVMYYAGASLFSPRVGRIAAIVAALSPALSEHSALARPYSLLPLLAMLASYSLIKAIENHRPRMWALYAMSIIAMLYTHHWAWLVLGGHWIAVVSLLAWRGETKVVRNTLHQWCAAQIAILVAYLPWSVWLLEQTRHGGHPPRVLADSADGISFFLEAIRRLMQATIVGYLPLAEPKVVIAGYRIFMIGLIVTAVIVFHFRERLSGTIGTSALARRPLFGQRLFMLTAAPFGSWALAIFLSLGSNMLLARCLVTLAPPLLIAVAYWLSFPLQGMRGVLRITSGSIILSSFIAGSYALAQSPRSNARELAALVGKQAAKTDLVIIAPEWLAPSFNRYFRPAADQIDFPHFNRIGAVDYLHIQARTADPVAFERVRMVVADAHRSGRRVWFVWPGTVSASHPSTVTNLQSKPSNYFAVGVSRAADIYSMLVSQYGQPTTRLDGAGAFPLQEYLSASLFAPKTAAQRPALLTAAIPRQNPR